MSGESRHDEVILFMYSFIYMTYSTLLPKAIVEFDDGRNWKCVAVDYGSVVVNTLASQAEGAGSIIDKVGRSVKHRVDPNHRIVCRV